MVKSGFAVAPAKLAIIMGLLSLALSTPFALAGALFKVPDEQNFAPVYARGLIATSEALSDLAVVYFYRQLDCVPEDFNLAQFFDPTGQAVNCPLLMEGIAILNDPEDVGTGKAPRQSKLQNLQGVLIPVYFVETGELLDALEDGVLTLPQLLALPSLQPGWADFHQEVLHPSPTPVGGGAKVVKFNYNGHGFLADGRTFKYHVGGQVRDGETQLRVFNIQMK